MPTERCCITQTAQLIKAITYLTQRARNLNAEGVRELHPKATSWEISTENHRTLKEFAIYRPELRGINHQLKNPFRVRRNHVTISQG